jgi:hypothetical protein
LTNPRRSRQALCEVAEPQRPERLKKGLRGRFGVYLPPLLETLGLAEVTHDARNNQMRAL